MLRCAGQPGVSIELRMLLLLGSHANGTIRGTRSASELVGSQHSTAAARRACVAPAGPYSNAPQGVPGSFELTANLCATLPCSTFHRVCPASTAALAASCSPSSQPTAATSGGHRYSVGSEGLKCNGCYFRWKQMRASRAAVQHFMSEFSNLQHLLNLIFHLQRL